MSTWDWNKKDKIDWMLQKVYLLLLCEADICWYNKTLKGLIKICMDLREFFTTISRSTFVRIMDTVY